MTIKDVRKIGIEKLNLSSPTPSLDVDVFLSHLLNQNKAYLLSHRNDSISEKIYTQFLSFIEKRATGLSVAYITGHKEFYGLDFLVNQTTLIPKPDTELLVSLSLSFIFNNFDNSEQEKFENRRSTLRSRSSVYSFDYLSAVRQAGGRQDAQHLGGLKVFRGGLGVNRLLENSVQKKRIRIADVCTGTACVAVSISNSLCKRNVPHSLVLIDISKDALLLAKKNVKRILPKAQIPFVKFLCADLLSTVSDEEHFDVIVANPPYVPSSLVKELLEDGRGEPSLALDGDATEENSYEKKSSDGLAIIRRLVPQSYNILAEGGMLFVESGEYNAKETAKIFSKAGFKNITTHYDLANLPRVTSGQKI